MARRSERSALASHGSAPSAAQLEAFRLIHNASKNLVLLPVVLNGQQRFAIAVIQSAEGRLHSLILGYLASCQDELATLDGSTCSPMQADDHKNANKHLH